MGLIRKTASASTLGVVKFNSNKEKARKNERKANKIAKGSAARANTIAAHAAAADRRATKRADELARADFVAVHGRTPDQVLRESRSPQPAPALETNPARWVPDPHGRHELRWWDGSRWTNHVSNAGQVEIEQVGGGEGVPSSLAASSGNLTEQLARLASLNASGALNDQEFAAAKARLLG